MLLNPHGTKHEASLRPVSDDYSVEAYVRDPKFVQLEDGSELIFASIQCPYCYEEDTLIETTPKDGEEVVLFCEPTQRESPVRVSP
jgi:hypothetical protein